MFRKLYLSKISVKKVTNLFRAGILGHGLGPLGHGVLSQLPGQKQPHCGLDLPGCDGGPLVVVSEAAGLGSNPLEEIVHERVHNTHCLGRHSSVRVDLFENLVNIDSVRFLPLLAPSSLPLGPTLSLGRIGRDRLLDGFTRLGLGRHRCLIV